MSNEPFTLTREVSETYRAGWGVSVSAVYESEYDDSIADIDVEVVEITRERTQLVGGAWCVPLSAPRSFMPVENFRDVEELTHDDAHDLRSRWFATEAEARAHAADVEVTWQNPEPWRSFVTLD